MKLSSGAHLTYCTNIHPGEHWREVWDSLHTHTLPLKDRVSPNSAMGVGLRLSNLASQELLDSGQLPEFKQWLEEHDLYVFTMNGFPYGGFHRTRVKDDVHKPDWTTKERVDYTCRLFDILAFLIPEGMEGGISTSPLSYRHWFSDDPGAKEKAWESGILNFAKVALHLHKIELEQGHFLHLDIEPEPDGFLENTEEVVDFFKVRLLPIAGKYVQEELQISAEEAENLICRHIQVCYDVCHYAVVYEEPAYTFERWKSEGIKIGKVQISAALKAEFPQNKEDRKEIVEAFEVLNESTYLHQVVSRKQDGSLKHFNDLPEALPHIWEEDTTEWRTHFHVPIFIDRYDHLESTRRSIEKVLAYPDQITQHWEVETYTWEVLPKEIRFDLVTSIEKELTWVQNSLTQHA